MATRNGVFYTDQGEGEISLLFLHFFGGSSNTWANIISGLSPNFRCIAPDLYGFGKSQTPESNITVALQTELVLQMIEELKLEKYVVIGHSMGGKIAVSMASRQPAGLQSVILVAPSPPTPEPIPEEKRLQLKNDFGRRPEMEKLVQELTVDPLEQTAFDRVVQDHLTVSQDAWNGWLDRGSREDISAEIKKVKVPVLVVNGSDDPNFTMAFLQEEIGRNLHQTEFIEVAHAGHLIPLEKPQELSEIISRFVNQRNN